MSKIDKYKASPGRIQERIPPGKMAFSTKARFMEMREYNRQHYDDKLFERQILTKRFLTITKLDTV